LRLVNASGAPVRVWRFPLDLDRIRLHKLATLLDEEERGQAARFRDARDRGRYVAAHGQLRLVLARQIGAQPGTLRFKRGRWGRPALAEGRVTFSLAHSGGQALCAVGEQVELGIDLEEMRPLPDMSRLALEIMSAAELDRFWAIPPAGRRRAFYTAWTLKEAYLKAVSVGLGRPPCEVEVDLRTVRRPMLLAVAGDRAEAARWSVTPLRAADGFVGVLLHTSTASQHKWQEEQR